MDLPARAHFPLFADLTARVALVIGGGEAAERHVRRLLDAGADVVVISPAPGEAILALEADGALTTQQRGYVRGDLEGAFIALVVEPDEEVRGAVAAEAEERGCLINVAGDAAASSFIVPSEVRRGVLQVAVSTGGASPEAARRARRAIASALGSEWETYAAVLAEVRVLAASRAAAGAHMPAGVLDAVADSDLLDRLRAGERPTAADLLDAASASTDEE